MIVTSFDCRRTISTIKVVVGTNRWGSTGVAVRIQRVVMHPDYSEGEIPNNLALIQLASALTYSNTIAPVTIDMEDPGSTTDVTVFSWGWTRNNFTLVNRLLKLSLTTMTRVACRQYWGSITANQICTKGGRRECIEQFYLGSPLIATSTKMLLGVESYINVCSPLPSVYTRVSQYVLWIQDTINPQN
ncbi:hypothetical protein Trydic_g12381 [Trypoxylus dichotomus]